MRSNKSRLNWKIEEDEAIRKLVEQEKVASWKKISKELRKTNSERKRTAKQCRERYVNFIKFKGEGIDTNQWTKEEQQILYEKFLIYGSKWVKLAPFLPMKLLFYKLRSQNKIKNKFYGSLRKILRKINQVQKVKGPKTRKQLKYESLLKFLQMLSQQNEAEVSQKFGSNFSKFSNLKIQFIEMVANYEQDQDQDKYLQFAESLHEFNSLTRFIARCRKRQKPQQSSSSQQQKEQKQTGAPKQPLPNTEVETIRAQEKSQEPIHIKINEQIQEPHFINFLEEIKYERKIDDDFVGDFQCFVEDPFWKLF